MSELYLFTSYTSPQELLNYSRATPKHLNALVKWLSEYAALCEAQAEQDAARSKEQDEREEELWAAARATARS